VPTIDYDGHVITESGIISQFLVDAHPSHLLPASNSPDGALRRARINFFVDSYFSKANPLYFKTVFAKTDEEAAGFQQEFVNIVVKEVEPSLQDAAPFFGGSSDLTLAEVRRHSACRIREMLIFDRSKLDPSSSGSFLWQRRDPYPAM
jgi:glutathione S-transferase